MVNDKNLLHARCVMTEEELHRYVGDDIEQLMNFRLSNMITDLIIDKMFTKSREYHMEQTIEYYLDCAVLTPERYKALLKAEGELARVKRYLND